MPSCPRPQPLPRGLLAAEPWWLQGAPGWLLEAARPGSGEAARILHEALQGWLRGRSCGICGDEAVLAAAKWSIRREGSRGYAVLEALVPLCARCRLAYWPGEAAARGLLAEARRLRARLCGDEYMVEETVREEMRLSARVDEWRVSLQRLHAIGVPVEAIRALEEAAERLAAAPIAPGWEDVTLLGLLADEAGLAAAAGERERLCSGHWSPGEAEEEARRLQLQPSPGALRRLHRWLRETGLCSRPPHEALELLEGYWAIPVTSGEAGEIVRRCLGCRGPWGRLRLGFREPLVAEAWVPVSTSPRAVAEALSFLEDLLGRPLEAVYRHAATRAVLYALTQ